MGSVPKQGLLTAYRRLLKPLVRVLVRNGVTYEEFSETAKLAFLDAAKRRASSESDTPLPEQLAAISGISVEEIDQIARKSEASPEELDSKLDQMVRILHGWHTDAEFTGPYGIPLELQFSQSSEKLSFSMLIERYGDGVSAQEALTHLLSVNALKETEPGWFKVLVRSYQSEGDSPENLAAMTDSIQNYVNVLDHNIQEKDARKRFFERHVYTENGIRDADIPRFRAFFEGRAQQLLEEIDNWVANLPGLSESENASAKKTGLCIYHYIEDERTDEKQ